MPQPKYAQNQAAMIKFQTDADVDIRWAFQVVIFLSKQP